MKLHNLGDHLMPGIEHAAATWYQLMSGQGAVPSTILKIRYQKRDYFVQASKAIEGTLLVGYLKTHPKPIFTNYGGIFTGSLMARPGDAKPDNYMVTFEPEPRLVGIDNDFAFVHPIRKGENKHYVELYDTIYVLPQINEPVSSEFKQHFLSQPPEVWLMRWVFNVYQQTDYYQLFASEGILSPEDMNTLGLPPRFLKGELHQFYQRLVKIHALLQIPDITHQMIFEALEPIAARYYQKVRNQHPNLLEAIHSIKHGAAAIEEFLPDVKIPKNLPEGPWHFVEQRTQTITEAVISWLSSFSFQSMPLESQRLLIDQLRDLHDLTRLTFRHCQALTDPYLQRLWTHFPHLTQIECLNCEAITEIGLTALLSRSTPIHLKITPTQAIDAAQWPLLYRYVQTYGHRITIQLPNGFEFALQPTPLILHELIEHDRAIEQHPERLAFFIPLVNINEMDIYGRTALHLAAKYGYLHLIERLIQAGINIEQLDFAQSKKNGDLIKNPETALQKTLTYLQEEIAKPNYRMDYACRLAAIALRLGMEHALTTAKASELYLTCVPIIQKAQSSDSLHELKVTLFHFLLKTKNARWVDHQKDIAEAKHLRLYAYPFTPEQLSILLKQCTQLQTLDITGYPLDESTLEVLLSIPLNTLWVDPKQSNLIQTVLNQASNTKLSKVEVSDENHTQTAKEMVLVLPRKSTIFSVPQALPTQGDGDCAFHAALGQWDTLNQRIESKKVQEQRAEFAKAIQTGMDSPLMPLIKTAIMALIMSAHPVEKHLQTLRDAYQKYETTDNDALQQKWHTFEPVLKQHSEIINYLSTWAEDYFKQKYPDQPYLFDLKKAFAVAEQEDMTLRALLMSLPELEKAYQIYKKPTQTIDFSAYFTFELLTEYAQFLAKPGQWLLPCELHLIAHVFHLSIQYYASPNAEPECFNPEGAHKVSVCFKAPGHYEQINVKPIVQTQLKNTAIDTTYVQLQNGHLLRLYIATQPQSKSESKSEINTNHALMRMMPGLFFKPKSTQSASTTITRSPS